MSFGIDLPSDLDWSQLLSSLDVDVGVEANANTCEPEHDVRGQTRVGHAHAPTPPKVGTRFSTASLKILKAWLRDHEDHPYPSSKDISRLEAQTGLEKQQITNWYANVRRRTRARHVPRPTSPSLASVKPQRQPPGQDAGRSIPGKPGPSPFSDMDPMQRWQNSPPEYEPSEAADILAAVSASDYRDHDGHDAKRADAGYTDRATSDDASSATSARRSNSSTGSSVGSAYSYASQTSRKSIDVLATQKPRRRKRKVATRRQADSRNGLLIATRTYQCTFCAETFATKHNWQRHEKSLHISLEGWECSPDGPTLVDADSNKATCVYCGLVNPDATHIAGHDYGECERRAPEERIFYRKDHLQQHLTLVHGAAFQRTSMETWKRQNQLIRSRCGFCNLAMESWDERVDHIAEHFKTGRSMADWEGGWGFEPHVADKIESAIPPYLIHYERYSPWPFTGYHEPSGTPSSAFELISAEMEYYSNEFMAAHQRRPTLAEMQYECCSRVLGAEQLTAAHNRQNNRPTRADGNGNVGNTSSASWLRDLVMSDESIAREARLRPLREAAKVSITPLRVNGKSTVFESCALEGELQQRVQASHAVGLAVTNQDIRVMACQVVAEMTAKAPWPSKSAQDFLIELIYTTCGTWFTKFRQRAGLPVDEACPSELHGPGHGGAGNSWHAGSVMEATLQAGGPEASLGSLTTVDDVSSYSPNLQSAHGAAGGLREHRLGDDSCYRRLMKELVRYTRSAMSPYNPNQHVPTDEELQHHARWIMFDDDDPWNQTPADNAEWLRHFKKDQGLDVDDPDLGVS
ncbi:homeobox and C2H2 transcription factor [Emericellopsis cladophorae]|uniref:Homeobox and C2H2 transcription factor n=1 Tax=Emericellopsis cladophorae TaxID=2686198 RepID=A0A9P9Y5J6_9HYPO|nr:homeobox and C2H2 transcription factor [Emericellopsis cladophorae]KAI6783826.1 homeobox and C2H2 transcription factor [Emericellopsis cladophorae]